MAHDNFPNVALQHVLLIGDHCHARCTEYELNNECFKRGVNNAFTFGVNTDTTMTRGIRVFGPTFWFPSKFRFWSKLKRGGFGFRPLKYRIRRDITNNQNILDVTGRACVIISYISFFNFKFYFTV